MEAILDERHLQEQCCSIMKRSQKSLSLLAFLLAVVGTVWWVARKVNGPDRPPIQIGLVTTLTGPASAAGIYTRNGALLAIEQANERGGIQGRQVEALVRDDRADPDEALRVDTELIERGVVAFLGHYLSSVSTEVVPLMNEHNMLMLSLGAATGDLYGLDDSFVRITLPNNIRTPIAARDTYGRLGVRKVAVVCDLHNAAYTRSVFDIYRAEFERLGGEIATAVMFNSQEEFDASGIAEQLVEGGAEGIFLITDALHGAMLCQHVRQRSASIRIAACAWAACVPDFISTGGRAVEGVTTVVESDDASTHPPYVAFREAYQARFGQQPSQHARDAYETTNILLKTLEKTQVPERLKEVLLKQGSFDGIFGTIGVDRYGEPIRPVHIMEIREGRMDLIATVDSRRTEE